MNARLTAVRSTNLKVIQEIIGPKDIATTMDIYAEATKEAKVESFEDPIVKLESYKRKWRHRQKEEYG